MLLLPLCFCRRVPIFLVLQRKSNIMAVTIANVHSIVVCDQQKKNYKARNVTE